MTPRRRTIALAVMWLALTMALLIAAPRLPWRAVLEQMHQARLSWTAAALIANVLILVFWAAEWRLLAPSSKTVPYPTMFEVVSVAGAIHNTIPFFVGEASGVGLLIVRAGLTRSAAVSVLALDQLFIGVAKLAVLVAAAVAVPLPIWIRGGVISIAVAVAFLLMALTVLAHRWTSVQDVAVRRGDRMGRWIANVVSTGRHLDLLRDRPRLLRATGLALAKKLTELAGIVAVQLAFGLDPSLSAALLVLAALAVATLVSVVPGNLGVYEAAVFASYRYVGVSTETAFGLALVQHLCFWLASVTPGYLLLTRRQLGWRRQRA